jgi:1-acyl-sn-glycerol-3-phosphate acyltransferase
MDKKMKKLRSLFTFIQMMISVSIIIILMMIFKKKQRIIRQKWAAVQMFLTQTKLEIIGKEDPNADMIIMNHQSIMDITIMEYLSSKNPAWIAKQEISNIPWFGKILTVPSMIIVERESKSSLVKLIKDTKDRLSTNRQIAIFPEGTRTDGKRIRKFKVGAKIIAEKHNLKVQPIVIINSLNIWDTKNFTQSSGTIKIIYLDTVESKRKTSWYEDVEKNMNEVFKRELKEDLCKS